MADLKLIYIYYSYSNNVKSTILAAECVKNYCNELEKTNDIVIVKDMYGKPHVIVDGIYLSISHTTGLWVCAINTNPLGIDVERTDAEMNESLLSKIKNNIVGDDSEIRFWTKIESCSKLMGTGLLARLDRLIEYVNSGNLCFSNVEINGNYICTLCVSAENRSNDLKCKLINLVP